MLLVVEDGDPPSRKGGRSYASSSNIAETNRDCVGIRNKGCGNKTSLNSGRGTKQNYVTNFCSGYRYRVGVVTSIYFDSAITINTNGSGGKSTITVGYHRRSTRVR